MARRKPREMFTAGRALLPELESIGTDAPGTATDARGLQAHRHAGAFELCYIARGSVEWWVNQEVHEVGPGDVYITKPDEVHGGVNAVLHPCELYWLTVRLPRHGRLRGMAQAHGAALATRYHALNQRRFPGDPSIGELLEPLLDEHRAPGPFSAVAARALLHQLLITVLRDHDAYHAQQRDRDKRISAPVHQAMQWMNAHLAEDFGMDEVADRVGLGISRLHERFRDEVGFSPADWRNRQRIRRAKHLLRDVDQRIIDIAMRTGFATSQYFATAFKRFVGMTPGAYREQLRDLND